MRFERCRGVLSNERGVIALLTEVNGDVTPGNLLMNATLVGRPSFYFSLGGRYTLDFTLYPGPSGLLRCAEVEVVSYKHPRLGLKASTDAKTPIIKPSPNDSPNPPPALGA